MLLLIKTVMAVMQSRGWYLVLPAWHYGLNYLTVCLSRSTSIYNMLLASPKPDCVSNPITIQTTLAKSCTVAFVLWFSATYIYKKKLTTFALIIMLELCVIKTDKDSKYQKKHVHIDDAYSTQTNYGQISEWIMSCLFQP